MTRLVMALAITPVERRGRGIRRNGGEKQFHVQPGETIKMALPPASGRNSDSGAEIDNSVFYAGHEDSLILTVTKLR